MKTEIKDQILAKYRQSVEQIKASLAVNIIDGTPYLLCVERDSRFQRGEKEIMVYGEWPMTCSQTGEVGKVRGFMNSLAVPNHLCGTIQFGDESIKRQMRALENAAARVEGRFFCLHWREFLSARLTEESKQLSALEEQFGK